MKILAIETSCDETAAAVLEIKNNKFNLLANIVSSQIKIHAKYGGIVPEIAARKQMEIMISIIEKVARQRLKDINYIAVTQGPGLITSLTVGVETAKSLALTLNKPLIAVNHLAGHIYSSQLTNKQFKFPALALVVSGGHTMLALMDKHNRFKIIGQTVDDAVGEAFDKVAKILNLGYPGGPIISKLAAAGDSHAFDLPRPMIQQQNFNFSFSGLKTAVLYLTNDLKQQNNLNQTSLNKQTVRNICASFQQACVDVLISKTLRAIKKYHPQSILLGGGVSANAKLRQELKNRLEKTFGLPLYLPDLKFTGDNAAMIALAAYYQIQNKKKTNPRKLKADPNLYL